MKKTTLTLLLIFISPIALAEWTWIDAAPDNSFSSYVNKASIIKKGNKVKMWTMLDTKTAHNLDGYMFLSMVTQTEYDCKNITSSSIYTITYSGNMGSGVVIPNHNGKLEKLLNTEYNFDQNLQIKLFSTEDKNK